MKRLKTHSVVLPVAVVAAAASLAAADAQAAVVELSEEYMDGYKGSGHPYDQMTVTDPDGVPNDLVVVAEQDGAVVSDASAPLQAGKGCALDGAVVRCRWQASGYSAFLGVDAGGGEDRVRVRDFRYPQVLGGPGADVLESTGGAAVGLNGGEGDDVLTADQGPDASSGLSGGPGRDVLIGSPGGDGFHEGDDDGSPDRIVGNGGDDRLSYAGRARPVRVDLAAGIGGEPGEGDTFSEIHRLQGGAAADELLGTDGEDEIRADLDSAGDLIDGRGGDDWISGSTHGDRLLGGDGADSIDAYGGRDLIDAGPGDDYVSAAPYRHRGVQGVACGDGTDVVRDPKRGTVALDCETVGLDGLSLTPLLRGARLTLRVTPEPRTYRPCALRIASRGTARVQRVDGWPASIELGAAPWSTYLTGAKKPCPAGGAKPRRFRLTYGRVAFAEALDWQGN